VLREGARVTWVCWCWCWLLCAVVEPWCFLLAASRWCAGATEVGLVRSCQRETRTRQLHTWGGLRFGGPPAFRRALSPPPPQGPGFLLPGQRLSFQRIILLQVLLAIGCSFRRFSWVPSLCRASTLVLPLVLGRKYTTDNHAGLDRGVRQVQAISWRSIGAHKVRGG
jgi:hypothetical protein